MDAGFILIISLLGLLFVFTFLMVSINRPLLGLFATVASIPLTGILSLKGQEIVTLSISNVMLLLLLFVVLLKGWMFSNRIRKIIKVSVFFLVVTSIANIFSGTVNNSISANLRTLVTNIGEIVVFLLVVIIVRDEKSLRRIVNFIFIICLAVVSIAIYFAFFPINSPLIYVANISRPFFGLDLPFDRSYGVISNPGIYGSYIAFLLTASLFFLFRKKRAKKEHRLNLRRLVFIITFFIAFLAVFVSQTRSTFIAIFWIICTMLVYFKRPKRLQYMIPISIVLLIIATLYAVQIAQLPIVRDFAEMRPHSVRTRSLHSFVALNAFRHHPVIGVGYWTLNPEIEMISGYLPGMNFLHNHYLNMLSSVGLLGFVPYALFLIFIIKAIAKNIKETSQSSILNSTITIVLFVMGGILLELALVPAGGHKFMWFIMGLGVAASSIARQIIYSSPKLCKNDDGKNHN